MEIFILDSSAEFGVSITSQRVVWLGMLATVGWGLLALPFKVGLTAMLAH